MATDLENLTTRRSAILTELAALDSDAIGGKANTNSPNAIDHVGYKRSLYDELERIDARIAAVQDPFEIETRGV